MKNILELTDLNYTSFIENNNFIVFIDFYSDTCAPCQTLLSYLPSLAEHYEEKEVVIAKVNVAFNPKLANKFMVKSVPLVLLIGKDNMVKCAEVGLVGRDKYFSMIDKELGADRGFFSRLFG